MEATTKISDAHEARPEARKMKIVYTITERQPGRSFWTRVGAGFINRDGSINLRLDAIPVSGTLQVRDWEPRDDRASDAPVRSLTPRSEGLARAERRADKTDKTATADLPF